MIIVFGSISMDMYLPVAHFPEAGETVLSPRYERFAGGKGANQALAAHRTGEKTALIGRTGDDGPGLRIVTGLRRDGVITSGVAKSENATGMAVVITDKSGESEVIVAAGANFDVRNDQIPDDILIPGNIVLLQTETPPQENWTLLERAKAGGATTILNLAPALNIPQDALNNVDYLIVNQVEARQIAKKLKIDPEKNMTKLAQALSQKGTNLTCIVTMGPQGSVAVTPEGQSIHVPCLTLDNVVDTTGSGDAYCGTLAGLLHKNMPLPDAMRHASVAGSLSCLALGGQDSYAYFGDIEEKLVDLGDAVIKSL